MIGYDCNSSVFPTISTILQIKTIDRISLSVYCRVTDNVTLLASAKMKYIATF